MNMTDRELLEPAAKAAGIEGFWVDSGLNTGSDAAPVIWNPLTNDGDALRLAVKLKIDVCHTNIHSAQVHAMADYEVACIEDSGDESYAATRRAIVRAAAEIGKNKL